MGSRVQRPELGALPLRCCALLIVFTSAPRVDIASVLPVQLSSSETLCLISLSTHLV